MSAYYPPPPHDHREYGNDEVISKHGFSRHIRGAFQLPFFHKLIEESRRVCDAHKAKASDQTHKTK